MPPVVAGASFSRTLPDPGGITIGIGARVEAPVTRAIESAFQMATLVGSDWTVVLDAPVLPGEYNLVWRTPDAEPPLFEAFEPLIVVSVAATVDLAWPPIDMGQVTPSIDDVAKLERTRTKDPESGDDEGTFTDTTFPSADDVADVIDDASDMVLTALPDAIDPQLYPKVRTAIKLQAAILIETSFFRVQETGGGASTALSTYRALLGQTMNMLTSVSAPAGLGLELV